MLEGVFSDPFADVRLSTLRVGKKDVAGRLAVEVKDDAGEWAVKAFVSKDYQLMKNRFVFDMAEDIASRAPASLGGFKHLKSLWNGKQFAAYFASNEPVAELDGGAGKLQVGLMAWNSYDGSRKVGFEVYALNAFCTNQYHSRNRFGFFAWRHQPGAVDQVDQEDALQSLSTGVANVIALAPALEQLRKEAITLEHLRAAKVEVGLPQSRWGDVLDRLDKEEPNRFGLFQSLTYVASHLLGGMSALGIGNAITDYFLSAKSKVYNHTDAETVLAGKS